MGKKIDDELSRRRAEKARLNAFQQGERNITVNKDNQILLNKLVDISHGKWSSVTTAANARGDNRSKHQSAAAVPRIYKPTSLNIIVRKKETERIERENHQFAKRLFDK